MAQSLHLPHQPTPFIGREQELDELTTLLCNPVCRLLTLVGPGGIGKTRLAIQIVSQQVDDFRDGVFFIQLQPLSLADNIAPVIAGAVGIQLDATGDPHQQLLDYLQKKHILLLLDNFEHLLDGAKLVADIVDTCPNVKILATSRESLKVKEEWLRKVRGLSVPVNDDDKTLTSYDAVQLFLECASRVRRDFSESELIDVFQICRLVEGLPLGIELAAAWTNTLPCIDIVYGIEQDIEFLETRLANVEQRHRSMKAVFNWSWNALSDEQQVVLRRLSVFRGGFLREAAEQVAGATLKTLSALADKSMLRRNADRRYDIHELQRQYAEQQLIAADEVEMTYDAHCVYYADFIHKRATDLKGKRQRAGSREIAADFENVRSGWYHALKQHDYGHLRHQMEGLWLYSFIGSYKFDVGKMFGDAQQLLAPKSGKKAHPAWAQVMVRYVDIKKYPDNPIAWLKQGLALAQEHGDQTEIAFCYCVLGIALSNLDDNSEAVTMLEESLTRYRELNKTFYIADVLDPLALSYTYMGKRKRALRLHQESLKLCRKLGDKRGIGISLVGLGIIARRSGNSGEYERYMLEASTAFREVANLTGIVFTNQGLAMIAFLRGDFETAQIMNSETLASVTKSLPTNHISGSLIQLAVIAAMHEDYIHCQQLCEESISLYFSTSNYWLADWGLAIASCGLGTYEQARQHLLDALTGALLPRSDVIFLVSRVAVAPIILSHDGANQQAVEVLSLVSSYPDNITGWLEKWSLMTRLRADLQADLGAETYDSAWERGKMLDIKEVAGALLKRWENSSDEMYQQANQALYEPLTDREFEVLRLVAGDLSNPAIAESLTIAVTTVKTHVGNILRKLDATDRHDAVDKAKGLGLL